MKPKLLIPLTLAASTLFIGACATEPGYMAYTGKNRPLGPCRREKDRGSNLIKTICEPARDDADKLEMIGTIHR